MAPLNRAVNRETGQQQLSFAVSALTLSGSSRSGSGTLSNMEEYKLGGEVDEEEGGQPACEAASRTSQPACSQADPALSAPRACLLMPGCEPSPHSIFVDLQPAVG